MVVSAGGYVIMLAGGIFGTGSMIQFWALTLG